MKLFAFAIVALSTTLCAQSPNASGGNTTGFSVPALGFISGQAPAQLQPILGIPGSARLGSPLLLPSTVTGIHIAPGHAYALVQQGPSSPLSMVLLQGIKAQTQNLQLTPIPGTIGQVDLLAFSPMGNSAAIYSRETNQLQVLTGLPKLPRLSLNLSNLAITGAVQKLAVSDDAQAVLISDSAGSVDSVLQNGALLPVHHSPEISALAFVTQSHDSIICDRGLNTISMLRNSTATPFALGPAMNDTCQPEGAVSTADGKTLLLACPAQHAVLAVNSASGLTHVYNVAATPASLDRLALGDVFLMSPAEGGTYWLFVWQPSGLTASFIAAAPNRGQGSGH
jgi:hypothetical protein